jgi:PAS domain S-box-containing protein
MQADALEQKVKERTRRLEQMNEELKLSEERYFKMTEEVQDYAIILLDPEGTIVNWNKGAEKIKGYREKEIIGKNFSIFYLAEDRKRKLPEDLIAKAQNDGRAMHEGWRKRKDGSTFWGSVVITALHDDENNIIGFTKVTRDLTERKYAEDTMRQHATELEIKNRQLEQFAYIASHDLQEPLRKIRTFVQVLQKKIEDPQTREKYFEKINSSAKRMGDLIQSVLNYSRLTKNDQQWVPTDLNVILENVKSDYELLMSEKKAKIKSDVLPTVKGISLQLSQLFANLIGNSLKFSEEKPLIIISSSVLKAEDVQKRNPLLDSSRNYVELIFKDNGVGFDQQYADKIFTIFQRLNSREEYSGTGIGLALCKKIVENHDGHIQARGKLGKGAEFVVYLPLT